MFNAVASSDQTTIDGLKCLRVEYYHNACSLCMDICPKDAITLGNNKRVALDPKVCIDCSACIGSCPTSAISDKNFDPNLFVVTFSASEETKLSCKSNTPCLNVFNVEQMISLGLRNESLSCDMSHCAECELNMDGKIEASIISNIDETNKLLEMMESEHRISTEYEAGVETQRRKLFTKFVAGVNELQNDREIEEVFDVNDTVPVHRQLLQNSLKSSIASAKNTTLGSAFSFIANKEIDFQSCTNCGDCIQFCPTNALTYSADQVRILFQEYRCIACSICDDICKPKSFSDKAELDLVTIAFDRATLLLENNFVLCTECKTSFPQKGEETICNRCVDFVNNSQDMFTLARDL